MKNIIIVGTSTTAERILCFVNQYALYNVLGFAVNRIYKDKDSFCGLPVYCIEELDSIIDKNEDFLFVAMQWNNLNADRKKVYMQLKDQGYKFANLISPTALINGNIVGENCWITDNVIIDYGTTISDNVYVKTGAFIAENVKIDKHVFIGAKSLIAGESIIGEQSFIGLSAVVFDKVIVGKRCIVGACTALKRNLNDFSTIKTNMENYTIKQYTEDVIESKLQFKKIIR